MKQGPSMDMVIVRDYVNACAARRWRPVFTREQMRGIAWHCHAGEAFFDMSRRISLFGVLVEVDDTPRPPMPAELMVRA